MVDRNLFLHDLAIVAILKNEGAYLKEWLDYHLLAGVEHFYLYDNDSPDNQAEVVAPYVAAGLVDYFHAPGKFMQYAVYNDAIKKFKFHCRYMAFIDGDEFIYPKTNRSIVEVVDEILSEYSATALGINWQIFGSNGQDKADYTRGVLERFTRRAPSDWMSPQTKELRNVNIYVKPVVNPRRVDYFFCPHVVIYFGDLKSINSNGAAIVNAGSFPILADKIVVNHYVIKSREEYTKKKMPRGFACSDENPYTDKYFQLNDRNEVFDDGILKYRAARAEIFSLEDETQRFSRVTEALTEILSAYVAGEKFSLETALTCRALSSYLRKNFPEDAEYWQICEESSLAAILKSLQRTPGADAQLFIRELPIFYACLIPPSKKFFTLPNKFF